MESLFAFAVLVWTFIGNFFQKHINVFSILLINSYFLGFVDRDTFGILNKFDLNAVCLVSYMYFIMANFSIRRLMEGVFAKYIIALMALYTFGVFYPVYNGDSSVFWSIKEGKEYIHYLAYFAVYLSVRKISDVVKSWSYIKLLSLYYGILQIAYILGVYKLDILHYIYRADPALGIVKVYQPIFSIVFLGMFYYLWSTVLRHKKSYIQLVFLFISGMLTAFRSYILGSFLSLGIVILSIYRGREFIKLGITYTAVIVISILAFSVTITGSITDRFISTFDSYIYSGVREFTTQKGGSLAGRDSVNKFRWEYFKEKPLLGYGFIDKESDLGQNILIRHHQELAMIDTGYLDVLVKFGIIGSIIFYGIFFRISWILGKIIRQDNKNDYKVEGTAVLCFILTLLAAQATHSGLTFSFGIIPLCIGLALIDSSVYSSNQK